MKITTFSKTSFEKQDITSEMNCLLKNIERFIFSETNKEIEVKIETEKRSDFSISKSILVGKYIIAHASIDSAQKVVLESEVLDHLYTSFIYTLCSEPYSNKENNYWSIQDIIKELK